MPALRAFLAPLPGFDFGDSLLPLLVHIAKGKLCLGIQMRNRNHQSSEPGGLAGSEFVSGVAAGCAAG
jgi:hypothetical protein